MPLRGEASLLCDDTDGVAVSIIRSHSRHCLDAFLASQLVNMSLASWACGCACKQNKERRPYIKKYPVGLNGYEREYAEQPISLIEKIVIAIPVTAGILSIVVPIALLIAKLV